MKKKLLIVMALLSVGLLSVGVRMVLAQSGNVYHEVQVVDERGASVTTISSVLIYAPDTTTDATIYSDRGLNNAITLPMTTSSTNTTLSDGTFSWYGPDGYDFSITDGTNITTNANHRTRSSSEGTLIFPSYLQSISTLTYTDAQSATWGTGSDWVSNGGNVANTMTWIPATTDTSTYNIGSANFTSDFRLFGSTSGYNVIWDTSEDTLELLDNVTLAVGAGDDFTISHNGTTTTLGGAATSSGIHTFSTDVVFDGTNNIKYDDSRFQLHFQDDAILGIGGVADAAGDVTMTFDGNIFYLTPAVADQSWYIGDGTTGFDTTYAFEDAGEIIIDYDGDDILLQDAITMEFGTGGDITVNFSGTDFKIDAITADEAFLIGDTTTGFDMSYAFETAGTISTDYDGYTMTLSDDMSLVFGTGADASIMYDETTDDNLEILCAASGFSLTTNDALVTTDGAAANQFKVDATGTVAGNAIVFETSDGGVLVDADGSANGDITLDGRGTIAYEGEFRAISRVLENHSANHTLTSPTNIGTLITVDTAAVVITLPVVETGATYTIMNIGADGTEIHVDVNAADRVLGGCEFAALDDGDQVTNTGATADKGDYVTFTYGTAVGWFLTDMVGIWADGG